MLRLPNLPRDRDFYIKLVCFSLLLCLPLAMLNGFVMGYRWAYKISKDRGEVKAVVFNKSSYKGGTDIEYKFIISEVKYLRYSGYLSKIPEEVGDTIVVYYYRKDPSISLNEQEFNSRLETLKFLGFE